MKTTTFTLVRHGETEWSRIGRLQGHNDIPLSNLGIQQAQALGSYLLTQKIHIDVIYSSDLKRAIETAEILGNMLNLKPLCLPNLRQEDVGLWTGLTQQDVEEQYPGSWKLYKTDPTFTGHNGESLTRMSERATSCFYKLAHEHFGKSALIVTHSQLIKALLSHIDSQYDSTLIRNTSCTIVQYKESNFQVVNSNSIQHLTEEQ